MISVYDNHILGIITQCQPDLVMSQLSGHTRVSLISDVPLVVNLLCLHKIIPNIPLYLVLGHFDCTKIMTIL